MAARRNAVIVWTVRCSGWVLTSAELVRYPLWSQFIALIGLIYQQNGIIVVPAGDDGSHIPVTKKPAVLCTSLRIPLVVVGAVDLLGNQEPYSQDLSKQLPKGNSSRPIRVSDFSTSQKGQTLTPRFAQPAAWEMRPSGPSVKSNAPRDLVRSGSERGSTALVTAAVSWHEYMSQARFAFL